MFYSSRIEKYPEAISIDLVQKPLSELSSRIEIRSNYFIVLVKVNVQTPRVPQVMTPIKKIPVGNNIFGSLQEVSNFDLFEEQQPCVALTGQISSLSQSLLFSEMTGVQKQATEPSQFLQKPWKGYRRAL